MRYDDPDEDDAEEDEWNAGKEYKPDSGNGMESLTYYMVRWCPGHLCTQKIIRCSHSILCVGIS